MLKKISVINKMRARIIMHELKDLKQLAWYIQDNLSMNKGTFLNAVWALQEALIHFARLGFPVKLDGVGILSPKIERDGSISLQFRPSKELKMKLGTTRDFGGKIVNKQNAGKSAAQLIDAWIKAYPDKRVAA